jgi:hypothetical protein
MIFAFFSASLMSAAAYLQSEARWWTGPLSAIFLFAAGYGANVLLWEEATLAAPADPIAYAVRSPQAGIVSALFLCALLLVLGTILALGLRVKFNPTQVGFVVFLLGWVGCLVAPLVI